MCTPLSLYLSSAVLKACLTFLFTSFFSASEFSGHPRFVVGEDCNLFGRNQVIHTERDIQCYCVHLLVDIVGGHHKIIPLSGFKASSFPVNAVTCSVFNSFNNPLCFLYNW